MKILTASLFAVIFTLATICASADEPDPSPEQLVSQYFQKMAEKDTAALAGYMHGDELAKFKKMLLPVFEAVFASGQDRDLFKEFTQGDTLAQVQNYSSTDFFSRFLRWVMVINPGMTDILKQSTIKTIGHVSEKMPDGEVIHVVCRMTSLVEGMTISKMSVISLRQDDETWKLLLTGEIEGIAQALQRQVR